MNLGSVKDVGFDIVLKGVDADSSGAPDVSTIDQFRPPQAAIEKCRRWLAKHGVACHATDFGLACTAPKEVFESLFVVKLKKIDPKPGKPAMEMSGQPRPPEPIADLVDQVTLMVLPELF